MKQESVRFRKRLPIDAYGDGGFRLGGLRFEGSLLLLADSMEPWTVTSIEQITESTLFPILDSANQFDFVLLGSGSALELPPSSVKSAIAAAGLGLEIMATPSACRSYNVLIAEDRRLAAALIAVP